MLTYKNILLLLLLFTNLPCDLYEDLFDQHTESDCNTQELLDLGQHLRQYYLTSVAP